ncbi:conserved hypothetical protein 374 [Alkaliphilus metalliredigens QYMF]|uniref:Phosphatidylglycerol lysyltransferase n=1 Tax=Alkaliphilus metalliredigens (strain QYMF) TaxID=293826 RepID=A6TLV1_ALKMQ|nr:lysylphosphatidylglycerol synthase transmembrane domain-containing protein [Alkaliphilus metalliredigens]ABR47169.1 conserved hypothetical protein 374 [Alkaliphilus metalliredigens QYMF]
MLGIIIIIGRWVDWQGFVYTFNQISLPRLILACLLQLITLGLISFQWIKMGQYLNLRICFWKMLDINLTGTFVESITPSVKAGGEATKAMMLCSQFKHSISEAVSLVGLQKTISSIGFMIMSGMSVLWFLLFTGIPMADKKIVGGTFILFVLFITTLLWLLMSSEIHWLWAKIPIKQEKQLKLMQIVNEFQGNFRNALRDRRFFAIQLMLSLGIWSLFAVKAYLIGQALGLEIGFFAIALTTYISYMVAMVPLTPGGIGTFEGMAILLMGSLGVPTAKAAAFALILRFVTFWFVFLLSALYLLIKNAIKIITKNSTTDAPSPY